MTSHEQYPAGAGNASDETWTDIDQERGRTARLIATVVAAAFVLVGVLGFVPGVVTSYDQLELAGHESGAELLGIFQVSVLHNVLHLLLGVVGLVMARRTRSAVTYLFLGSVVYLALFVYGIVVDHGSDANVVPLDDADNVLHLVLGLGMLALGLVARASWQGSNANRTAM